MHLHNRIAGESVSAASNGNITGGAGRTIWWDAENRPISITLAGITTTFTYPSNGRSDGKRVKKAETNGSAITTTIYVGSYYEETTARAVTETVKYYYAGAKRIAMRRAGTLSYMFSDHLGSTSVTFNASTGATSTVSFYPYGGTRFSSGSMQTDRLYTGQRWESGSGLYDYGARQYDAALARFIQPDPVLPDPYSPQDLNRYTYTRGNPVRYTDPTGNACVPCLAVGVGVAARTWPAWGPYAVAAATGLAVAWQYREPISEVAQSASEWTCAADELRQNQPHRLN